MLDDESDAEEAVQQPPPPSGPENAPAAVLEQSPAVPDYAPGAVSDSENQVEDPTNVKEEEEDSDSDIEVVYIKPASKKAHRSWTKLKEEQLAHTAASVPLAASSSQTSRAYFAAKDAAWSCVSRRRT